MSTGAHECPASVLVDLVAATQGGAHRPIHAAGIGLTGTFTPANDAGSFSRAAIFTGQPTAVTVRFSDGVGQVDGDQRKPTVRGFAVRFHVGQTAAGTDTGNAAETAGALDMIAMTLPSFFASTPDQFESFARVSVPSVVTGVEDRDALVQWLREHPSSSVAVGWMQEVGIDVSYGAVTYYGIHAFNYTGSGGEESVARFMWIPDHPQKPLPRDSDLSDQPPDRLRREITARARDGEAPGFTLAAQLQGPDDLSDDSTRIWTSKNVKPLGHLQLGALVADQYWQCEAMRFNPTRLIDGIDLSDDPILHARGEAYADSAARRCVAYPTPPRVQTVSSE